MNVAYGSRVAAIGMLVLAAGLVAAAEAASPSAEQALRLAPVQPRVDYAKPNAEETADCKIHARKIDGHVGWIVESPDGLPLRKFVDTNDDNVVDRWSYYKDGLEVYRDIDADFNGKADQYRWFHTGGSRWALDKNEDGKIDAWKTISAEEVTAEVVAALANRDADRFARLILTAEELKSLGLGQEKSAELAEMIGGLRAAFGKLAAGQRTLTAETQWLQFSGAQPGVVPAGTEGSTRDVRVYENIVAIVQSGDQPGQVQIGTLVQVDDVWRVLTPPELAASGSADVAASGVFFRPSVVNQGVTDAARSEEADQRLLADLEKLDQEAAQATSPEQRASQVGRRADLLEKIAGQVRDPQDRAMWLRQLADMVSAAVQSGEFPEGAKKLQTLVAELEGNEADKDLAAYFKFRQLTADYGLSLQAEDADFAKIQTQWLKDLQQYVTDYPTAPDTAEAMLQLAIAQEFAGQEEEAKKWYAETVKGFPNLPAATKAAGAQTRLNSVGKTIELRGKSSTGGIVDLAKLRGHVVLVQYWATWCEPAKRDMAALKELATKYGPSLSIIGVNLDNNPTDLAKYLAENRLPWPQIFESGGLDSRPANQLGILTLPTMILVDQQGKVVDRNVQTAELEGALKKLIR
ncbi:MAG: redoxin domain-containing protein [Pirellulales bacterium]|nr:redoxin domain-containing protein [Pirellulales bacterium]